MHPLKKISILIIGYNIERLNAIKLILEKEDCTINIIKSNNSILKNAKKRNPDLIIYENASHVVNNDLRLLINNNPKNIFIPFLYVTYNAYEENYTTKSNEYAYITYPFSNDELLSKVTTLINYKYRPVELSDIPLPNYNESKPSDRDLMKNLNIFLFKNIKSDFFVENIAEYCQVGQSSLDKKIRRITGKNITQYVREFRLEYSIILMSRGVRSVKTLFEESGFKSEAYYSLSFKKYKGIGAKTYSRRYCF